ncbi:hypothetical protein NEOLEDRAFT_514721 [Neolentinus lepideus HHB14362 ss-1]|uniref:Uncharacterized protein n=1 Tax=Neolentinus lepideus HHB14362 ss-1 TaxID=1314782 RepID=A0A165RGS2_9AGAM|nr:hypothetical protein NEOLEDRAFT_514721 [Neolentinus lepideus HHB14362 ss-1]
MEKMNSWPLSGWMKTEPASQVARQQIFGSLLALQSTSNGLLAVIFTLSWFIQSFERGYLPGMRKHRDYRCGGQRRRDTRAPLCRTHYSSHSSIYPHQGSGHCSVILIKAFTSLSGCWYLRWLLRIYKTDSRGIL